MNATAGIFIVDFVARPFFKIWEKMPLLMLCIVLLIYGTVAYFVIKSAYLSEENY